MREAALMIEWCAKDEPGCFPVRVAAIQKECLAWKKAYPIETARDLLSIHARHQSDLVWQMAGLLSDENQFVTSFSI